MYVLGGKKVRKSVPVVFCLIVKFFNARYHIWLQWKTSGGKPSGTVGPQELCKCVCDFWSKWQFPASSQRDNKCSLICHCTSQVCPVPTRALLCSPVTCSAFGAELLLHTRGAPALPAEEVTRTGHCPGAASQAAGKLPPPTPSLVWEGSGHGEVLGTVQSYPRGLWEMGKEQGNFLLCCIQCWHCQHCHPTPRNAGF